MDKTIAKVLVGLPLEGPFDYRIPHKMAASIQVGCRVWVRFGFRKMVGYIVGFSQVSKFKKVRPLISLIDAQPILSERMLKFSKEFAAYYCCSWAEAIETSLPEGIRKGRPIFLGNQKFDKAKNKFQAELIHDSFTEEYRDLIDEAISEHLQKKQGILFLVPEKEYLEIREKGLEQRFKAKVICLDRGRSSKAQLLAWQQIKNGEADIVLGTRSAVFSPLPHLGLIVIENEDNPAYKQEQGPFYHARQVAIMRAKEEGLKLVLTSRTPSLEAMTLTKNSNFKLIRVEPKSALPQSQIVDLSLYRRKRDSINIFSLPLTEALNRTLSEKGKAILFINRKGFSTILRCRRCGFSLKCPRCNVGLTYHYEKKKLVCRYCNYRSAPVELCPQCNSDYIRYLGIGIEKIESELNRLFPQKRIQRLDSDKKTVSGDFDILIATQIALKESFALSADLVAALEIDSALNRLDFRAAERTFFLLVRLLRLAKKIFIIQTNNKEHYSIQAAAKADFKRFYRQESRLRRSLHFPPYSHFISVGLRGPAEEKVKNTALDLYQRMSKAKTKAIQIFEPHPDMPAKLRGNYRWSVLVQGKDILQINLLIRKTLKEFKHKSGIIISVDVDI